MEDFLCEEQERQKFPCPSCPPFFAGSSEKELIKEESSLRQTILLQIERKEGGALFDNTKVEICLEG